MSTCKQAKDANSTSGSGRTTCPFYDEIDNILGTRAASSPSILLDNGVSPENPVTEDETSKCVLTLHGVFLTIFVSLQLVYKQCQM